MHIQVKSDQDLRQLCGTPSGFGKAPKRSATVTCAGVLPYHAPPQNVMSTEVAEDVFEASFARGLAAAECFEVSTISIITHWPCVFQSRCSRLYTSVDHKAHARKLPKGGSALTFGLVSSLDHGCQCGKG